MKFRSFIVTSVILALVLLLSSSLPAQLTRVNVGYSTISADQLPGWVAKDAGIFERNGLNVDLIFFTGGSTAILALVSGDVPITQVSGPGLVNSVMAGSDAVFVAAGITSLNYVLMGRPGVKTTEQLKGGTVAISRFGSATDSIARFALKKIGLTPGKGVTIVQVGSGPDRFNAALTGKVTAAVINPSKTERATGFIPVVFAAPRRWNPTHHSPTKSPLNRTFHGFDRSHCQSGQALLPWRPR